MATYDVYTNLDPEALTSVAIDTYLAWVNFALGRESLGGQKLDHPSGRYAAQIQWRQTGEAVVSVFTTDTDPISTWIEEGTAGFTGLKELMLAGGKVGKHGRYRDIPIRKDGVIPEADSGMLIEAAKKGSLPSNVYSVWTKPRLPVDAQRWVRMSDANPSQWIIPPMRPYSPARILAELLERATALVG